MASSSSFQQIVKDNIQSNFQIVLNITGGGIQTIQQMLTEHGASQSILEVCVPYNQQVLKDLLQEVPQKIVSLQTAQLLSQQALKRSSQFSELQKQVLGVGCSCALATSRERRGQNQIHISFKIQHMTLDVQSILEKGKRTRAQEDVAASQLLLHTMRYFIYFMKKKIQSRYLSSLFLGDVEQSDQTKYEQDIGQKQRQLQNEFNQFVQDQYQWSVVDGLQHCQEWKIFEDIQQETYQVRISSIENPLQELIEGRIECIEINKDGLLLNCPRENRIYLPGSFNPLHNGHIKLLNAGISRYKEVFQKDIYEGYFELSILNADKGLINIQQLQQRLKLFIDQGIPLVITRKPLYTLKAKLLRNSGFVVGYDTAIRIINKKYYQQSEQNMRMDLQKFKESGGKFLVAGRIGESDGVFYTLKDIRIPQGIEDLFIEISEDKFRMDLSSTQIRSFSQQER